MRQRPTQDSSTQNKSPADRPWFVFAAFPSLHSMVENRFPTLRKSLLLEQTFDLTKAMNNWVGVTRLGQYLGSTPHPVTITTRIIQFLVGNPYKPSFVTVTGRGVDPSNTITQNTNSPEAVCFPSRNTAIDTAVRIYSLWEFSSEFLECLKPNLIPNVNSGLIYPPWN